MIVQGVVVLEPGIIQQIRARGYVAETAIGQTSHPDHGHTAKIGAEHEIFGFPPSDFGFS